MIINYKITKRRGSILIEVLLSVVILATCISIVVQAMTSSLRAARHSSSYTQAMILLDNKMGEILKKGSVSSSLKESGRFEVPFDHFQYELTTRGYEEQIMPEAADVSDLNRVELSVVWGSENLKKQLAVHTLLLETADEN